MAWEEILRELMTENVVIFHESLFFVCFEGKSTVFEIHKKVSFNIASEASYIYIFAEFIYPEFQKVALAHSAAAQLDSTEATDWASATFWNSG